MTKDKIMITGSTSGVAIELASHLKKYNVIKVSRLQIDVTKNFCKYENFIIKNKPKIIINCIAANGIDYCENNPQEAFKVNTAFPVFLAKISQKIGAKLIHFSTAAVFSGKKFKKLYNETSIANPNTIYGISKYFADEYLSCYTNILILRVPMLYGPTHKKQLISRLLLKIMKNNKIYASSDVYSTPLYIPELAKIIVGIIKNKKKFFSKKSEKIINVSSKNYISIYQLIRMYAVYLKKTSNLVDVKNKYFSNSLIKPKYLGLKSKKKYTSQMLINDCVKDHLEKINK